ncbi:phosphopantetheine-binding protein [Streptomyces sp. NBC_01089]|uniref:phosphopantetheine-binding protein n=1 Tax=Streptomyces sp. NBC_01089 TaxID=2903747 RepID=UPI00386C22DE|nr:phosphopantetheine-binding protein [Streptomyces sp. NBC_01089]WSU46421.1 phosphopantetheine-binding protein [Streptomyces sp. NBC_01089]
MSDTVDEQHVEVWLISVCQALGLDVAAAEDDFFEAGGTSLSAMKLIARVEETFGEDTLPPDDLFAQSSVRALASAIERNRYRPAPLAGT